MAATTIPSFKLATGKLIPAVGFGTGTAWSKSESAPLDRNLIESIKSAIAAGYRHLDCAEGYDTEPEVGVAIKESGVPREELFITTKILRTIKDPEAGLKESLRKLQTSYVDLYLIHAPFFTPESHGNTIDQAWAALEKLHKDGLATSIGVSNFNTSQLKSLLSSANVKPSLNQIELNPYCTDPELISFSKAHDIVTAAYSPLAPITKFKSGPVAGTVNKIAKELGRTPAQVLLRWVIEQGHVVITTSSNEERQKEFLGLDFELGAKNIQEITKDGATEHHRLYWESDYGKK